jgi:hypothetical protein
MCYFDCKSDGRLYFGEVILFVRGPRVILGVVRNEGMMENEKVVGNEEAGVVGVVVEEAGVVGVEVEVEVVGVEVGEFGFFLPPD